MTTRFVRMSASSVPDAQDYILGLLTAAVPELTTTFGGPLAEEDMSTEMAWLGAITDHDEEERAFGSWDEEFTVQVVIQIRQAGGDERAGSRRVWAIREAFSQALRADYSLGGLLRSSGASVAGTRVEPIPLEDGWAHRMFVDVTCTSIT